MPILAIICRLDSLLLSYCQAVRIMLKIFNVFMQRLPCVLIIVCLVVIILD